MGALKFLYGSAGSASLGVLTGLRVKGFAIH